MLSTPDAPENRRTLHRAQADPLCARRAPHLHRLPNLTAYRLGVNLTRRVSGEVRPPDHPHTPTPEQFSTPTVSERYAQNKPRRVNMQARAASPARTVSLPGASSPDSASRARPLVNTTTLLVVNTLALSTTL